MLLFKLNEHSNLTKRGGATMAKIWITLTVLIAIFLVACSPNDTIKEKPPSDPLPTISQEIGRPPDLVVVPVFEDKVTSVILGKYCWEEVDKICNIVPGEPDELVKGHSSMSVKAGDKIRLVLNTSNPSLPKHLLDIDKINLVQFYKGEETIVEVVDKQFAAPQEPGKYYYSATLRWEGEIKGEANYAFSFAVQ